MIGIGRSAPLLHIHPAAEENGTGWGGTGMICGKPRQLIVRRRTPDVQRSCPEPTVMEIVLVNLKKKSSHRKIVCDRCSAEHTERRNPL